LSGRAIQALFQLSYSPADGPQGIVPAASQGKDTRMGCGVAGTAGGWAVSAGGRPEAFR
jgi:hypothetical protein